MKHANIKCEIDIISELYSGVNEEKLIEHALSCSHCLNKWIELDRNLLLQKNYMESKFSNIEDENLFAEKIDHIKEKSDHQYRLDNKTLNQVMNILSIIESYDDQDRLATPKYLENLIKFEMQDKIKSIKETIVIRISEGLAILGNMINELFLISNELQPIPVRSSETGQDIQNISSLDFYQQGKNEEKLVYHVVKDGLQSILLTIKFDNFKTLPNSVNIRSKNLIISSQNVKYDYVYFPKLSVGEYDMEFKYQSEIDSLTIPFNLV